MAHEPSPEAETRKLARRRFLRAAAIATATCLSPCLLLGCEEKPNGTGLASTNHDGSLYEVSFGTMESDQ
jgi:hypothetical protein